MRDPATNRIPILIGRVFGGAEGRCARVVASWGLAGGVAGGGILIGAFSLAGYGAAGLYLLLAPVLFLVGSLMGLAHGFALALVGRPGSCSRRRALALALVGGATALPLVGVSWLIANGITLTAVLRTEWRWSWLAVAVVGWVLGVAICTWAAVEGFRTLQCAYERCPRRGLGVVIVGGLFLASCILSWRLFPLPEFSTLQIRRLGRLALAAAGTLWIWLPAVYLSLHVACPEHRDGASDPEDE